MLADKPDDMESVMDALLKAEPKFWPYGLHPDMFDSLNEIRHDGKLAGFTAWQFRENGRDEPPVGYYAVGVLPQYRRKGLASKALKSMLASKPAHIGEVRAFIHPDNKPSIELAKKLGVKVQHTPHLQPEESPRKVARVMPRDLAPRSSQGLSLHAYMPVHPRRTSFTPEEIAAIQEGKDQWFGKVFDSQADSPAADMSSPGKGALLGALLGTGLGGAAGHLVGKGNPTATVLGAGGGALLAALANYFRRDANNQDIEEQMRRIPPNGTRRDTLADPVLQADLDRKAMIAAALSRAPGIKMAIDMSKFPRLMRAWQGTKLPLATGLGWATAHDAFVNVPKGEYFSTEHAPARAANFLYNTLMAGLPVAGSAKLLKRPTHAEGTPPAEIASAMRQYNLDKANLQSKAIMGAPVSLAIKDLVMNNQHTGEDAIKALSSLADAQRSLADATANQKGVTVSPNVTLNNKSIMDWAGENKGQAALAALLGVGALGGAGYLANRGINALREVANREQKGRIRVTLPTRKPGDAETQLEIPMRDIELSDTMFGKLRRDFRDRLRNETTERTRKIKLSPEEIERRRELIRRIHEQKQLSLV